MVFFEMKNRKRIADSGPWEMLVTDFLTILYAVLQFFQIASRTNHKYISPRFLFHSPLPPPLLTHMRGLRLKRWFILYNSQIQPLSSLAPPQSSLFPASRRPLKSLLSLLNLNPSDRRVLLQAHSQLVTCNSLIENPDTQIRIFNVILRLYSLGESPIDAISLYKQFEGIIEAIHFDSFTYSFLMKACSYLHRPVMGAQVHARVVRAGFVSHVYVETALVNMYLVCRLLGDAQKVFDGMLNRNMVTWNVMITSLVALGEINRARFLFDEMPRRNIVSWTGMIDGYIRMNNFKEAFSLFQRMERVERIMPTEITLLTVFPAVSSLGDLRSCQSIHAYGEKSGLNVSDIRLTNCLIDTYAKCGCIRSARMVFEEMAEDRRNLISWTSIVSGFAMHGIVKEAMKNFQSMEESGLKPNKVTFLSVLGACSHGGLIDEGMKFFKKMRDDYQLLPEIKHFGCVIDMLGRAGRLEEAEKLAWQIPKEIDNIVIWRTLLGACSFHGNVEVAERVTRKIQKMERGYSGDYVLFSNILTDGGKFVDAEKMRLLMDKRNVFKVPGCSLS